MNSIWKFVEYYRGSQHAILRYNGTQYLSELYTTGRFKGEENNLTSKLMMNINLNKIQNSVNHTFKMLLSQNIVVQL